MCISKSSSNSFAQVLFTGISNEKNYKKHSMTKMKHNMMLMFLGDLSHGVTIISISTDNSQY